MFHILLAVRLKGTTTPRKPPLVLILGLKDSEHEALIAILETWGTPAEMLPTLVTNESGQGKDRAGTLGCNMWVSLDSDC
jgi:hypothetical protein